MHPLPAEPRSRVEGRPLAPAATPQPCLFLELSPGALEGGLAILERHRRQLEQLFAHSLPSLADERQHPLQIDRDDRDRARMLDDLPLVLAPTLQGDVDELAVVDDPCLVGLHAANRSTSRRSSAPNQGGDPARAFARACSGALVAGMTTSTRGSESAHFNSACAHV